MKNPIRFKRPRLNYKKLAIRMTVVAIVFFGISAYLSYTRMYLTKERRFWMAINNSLSTKSVVREVVSGGTGNKSIEKTRFNYGYDASIDKLSSISNKSAVAESKVVTRAITTPTAQYISYQDIYTSEKKQDGSAYNFDSIKGLWANQAKATTPEEKDQLKLEFVQPHVTIVPFGNLMPAARRAVLKDLKDSGVYIIDYTNITNQVIDGKEYVSYPTRVKLKEYVTILQKHFNTMGYGIFPSLDPSQYSDTATYNTTFILDKTTNVLSGIDLGSGEIEMYKNYGVDKKAPIPANAIPVEELQAKLQDLQ